MTVKLNSDRDERDWLLCLQAAAATISGNIRQAKGAQVEDVVATVTLTTDELYKALRNRRPGQ